MLVALQLVVGRRRIWLPARWRTLQLAGPSREKRLLVFGADADRIPRTAVLGLDTLPSLGVVVMGLGVLMRDVALATVGAVIGAVGVATVLALGNFVVKAAEHVI